MKKKIINNLVMNLNKAQAQVRKIFNTKDIENIETILEYGSLGKMILEILQFVEGEDDTTHIDMAEQQLLGFMHSKDGGSLHELITGMGLTEKEWEKLKKDYPMHYLSEDDKHSIDLWMAN
jgi:hypothetical protein